MTALRPILRWAGSKRRLISRLQPFWSADCKRYVEPFAGSASLFFAINPSHALLGDVNEELIATYRTVRGRSQQVARALQCMPRNKAQYLRLRRQRTVDLSSIERAARFLYLNRYCFNGLYRTNTRGEFNVPYSPRGTGELPSSEHLSVVAGRLRRAELHAGDFEPLLTDGTLKGDFVYLDPPFAVENRRVFRQYGAQVFGLVDLHRLVRALELLDRRSIRFVVSYAYTAVAVSAFHGWAQQKVMTQRNIAGFARHRRLAAELIVTNCKS